jgi:predicted RNA-binding protein Jag
MRQQSRFDDDSMYEDLEHEGESLFAGYTAVEEADYDADVAAARELLVEVLKAMDVGGSVQVSRVDATQGGGPWILNVQGQGRQINALIGRRGDTLAALQYLVRLMVSHKLQHRVNLIVDVDGYKARRAERLRSLAARMAEQAISEGRTVVLEPMPPHERRLIHIALRAHPNVSTKSIGEGESRKVTIVPDKLAAPLTAADVAALEAEDEAAIDALLGDAPSSAVETSEDVAPAAINDLDLPEDIIDLADDEDSDSVRDE